MNDTGVSNIKHTYPDVAKLAVNVIRSCERVASWLENEE